MTKFRYLQPGSVIRVDGAELTVTGMRFNKGMLMQFEGRTAAALEISLKERGPFNVHLDQLVELLKL